jgi:hypothetical protein
VASKAKTEIECDSVFATSTNFPLGWTAMEHGEVAVETGDPVANVSSPEAEIQKTDTEFAAKSLAIRNGPVGWS